MKKTGSINEIKAKNWLESNNFFVIKQNYYSPYGEIDIIASKEKTIYFIEVKSSSYNYIPLTLKINNTKKRKITYTALDYIEKNNIDYQYTFSLITITNNNLQFYSNIIEEIKI